jgi:lambda repressor-like predicted transcriptional regulator
VVITKRNKGGDEKMKRKYEVLNTLKGKIREENENYRSLSKKTGISVNALNNKLNGYSVFDMREVSIIVDKLNIKPNEIIKYFFSQMLRNATKEAS